MRRREWWENVLAEGTALRQLGRGGSMSYLSLKEKLFNQESKE